jgi:hypothetical protein
MTTDRHLERDLPTILGEISRGRYPDYIDDVLATTAQRRQRPAWTFPERWLPVELVTTRVPTTRIPWRQLGALALLAILLASAIAAFVGTRTPRVPAPFGPAANGMIAMARDGDLYMVDPRTSQQVLLVDGPENDEWIDFTPDGTRGVFIRWGPDNGGMTAAKIGSVLLKDGAKPVFINKDVIHGDSWIQVGPNGHDIAFTAYDYSTPLLRIHVAALDGSTYHMFDDVQITDYGGLSYLAPNGRELVYLARSANLHSHDIMALEVATGVTRPILMTDNGDDVFGNISAAPDGKHLAYALRSNTGAISVHVVGIDGTGDKVVGHEPGATFEAWPQWDPQGRRLLIERDAGDGIIRPVIVDLGGGPDVVIDAPISSNGAGKTWAPDGASILAQRTAADGKELQQELWDARTGEVTPVSWSSITPPTWQRIAPAD